MTTRILLVCMAALLIAIPAFTQEQPKAEGEKSLTGCLNPGDAQGQFSLTVKEGGKKGEKVTVIGPADLEKHAKNHTVKVTGSMAKEGGKDVFKASKIEHVDATCSTTT